MKHTSVIMLRQVDSDLIRLASFSKWSREHTDTGVSLVQLAAAGFSYIGDSDAIRPICDYSKTILRGWLGTRHNPLLEHRSPSDETSSSCCRTVSTLKTDDTPLSKSRGDSDTLTRTLEVDKVAEVSTTSSLSRQMTLLGVDDVIETTYGDVRDAAAANLSKL